MIAMVTPANLPPDHFRDPGRRPPRAFCPANSPWPSGTSRSGTRLWPTAFSTVWCTTPTASRCTASRYAKSAAGRKPEPKKGRYHGSRERPILDPGPSGRKILEGDQILASNPKEPEKSDPGRRRRTACVAALRERRDKSAVEMPPHGKRGNLQNRLFHASHQAWKPGKKHRRRISTFPPRRLRDLSISLGRRKEKP